MTVPEMIEVLQGFQQGKTIEARSKNRTDWIPSPTPTWSFDAFEYRIKPEPREWYLRIANGNIVTHTYPVEITDLNRIIRNDNSQVIKVREVLE